MHVAGDAALLHSRAGGRGLNLGVEDACVLAKRLCEGGLESYAAERREIATSVIRMTEMLTGIATLSNPLAQVGRELSARRRAVARSLRKRSRRSISGIAYPNPVAT